MNQYRINMVAQCNTDIEQLAINHRKAQKYPKVRWSEKILPPVAVCGGGPGLPLRLDILRKWPGDIYAVNDTAGYLSDNGIPCYMYAIDASRREFKTGDLVKGAVFATFVHRRQFNQFQKEHIRVFNMFECDPNNGIGGGPTAVCRAANLFIKMGYGSVAYFGCEGSFLNLTHVTGEQKVAFDNMIIVRANGIDYITNASMVLQTQYLSEEIRSHPGVLLNFSDGLLEAMIQYPDDWATIAVTEDLKKNHERSSKMEIYTREYKLGTRPIWQPQGV